MKRQITTLNKSHTKKKHTQLHTCTHEINTKMQIIQSFYIVADVLIFHIYLRTIRKLP